MALSAFLGAGNSVAQPLCPDYQQDQQTMTDDLGVREPSTSLTELATWIADVREEHWVAYRKSSSITQCSHPDRSGEIAKLIRAGIVDVSQNKPLCCFG
jgi:hypothetical protein